MVTFIDIFQDIVLMTISSILFLLFCLKEEYIYAIFILAFFIITLGFFYLDVDTYYEK
jgi:hypothetical protein